MGKGNSKLKPEQMDDLLQHTLFDRKELSLWYKGFMKDTPSGSLDKEVRAPSCVRACGTSCACVLMHARVSDPVRYVYVMCACCHLYFYEWRVSAGCSVCYLFA